jgi:hypothetical protein
MNTSGNNNYIEVKPTSYNLFSLDVSDVSAANPLEVVLFTYSNGIKIKLKITRASESDKYITCNGSMQLYDKNDNSISISGVPSSTSIYMYVSKVYGDTISNVKLYYSPPQVMYGTVPNPNRFDVFGTYVYAKENASPYDAPQLLGVDEQYNRANFGIYWNFTETASISTDSDYNNLINGIIDKGDGTPITPILPSDDTSGEGGGDSANPDYNPFSEDVDFPTLPTITALSSGMISAYNPNNSMLTQLGQKLWSTSVIEELKKIWNDPMEGIISLHLMPFTPPVYGSKECKIGSYNTEIVMPTIISQFVQKYCGTVKVSERFASALDYSPYTTAYIHIPFVGIVPLDIDYIMNKTLDLRYQIDVLTGNGVAMLRCDGAILYEFPCNLAMSIPLTSVNHGALYRNIIDVAGNAGHAVVAGATGSGASTVANGVVRTLESALDTIASKASEVQKSGAITGGAGMLDVFEAYLIFHRPIQSLASDFNHFKGFPCNITYTLSELSGYTEVEYAHLEGVTATDEEKDEIQTLLQTGVIL